MHEKTFIDELFNEKISLNRTGYILSSYISFLDNIDVKRKFFYLYNSRGESLERDFIKIFMSYPNQINLLNEFSNLLKLEMIDISILCGRDIDEVINFLSKIDFKEINLNGYLAIFIIILNTIANNFFNSKINFFYKFLRKKYDKFSEIAGIGLKSLLYFLQNDKISENFIRNYEYVYKKRYVENTFPIDGSPINFLNIFIEEFLISFFNGLFHNPYRYFYEKLVDLRYILYILSSRYLGIIDIVNTFLSKIYLNRVAYSIAENFVGKNIPLYIYVEPIKANVSEKVFSILFGTFNGFFRNALWDVSQDINEYNYRYGGNIFFMGVYRDWIIFYKNGIKAYRAILCKDDYLIESYLYPPIPIKFCHILNLPRENEIEMHRTLAISLWNRDIVLVNPSIPSNRCNSKYLTHKFIEKYCKIYGKNIEMPKYIFLPKYSEDIKINSFIDRISSRRVIVKPDHGTEGIGIRVFNVNDRDKIIEYCKKILKTDDVIVEEVRGNMLYNSVYPFTIRINVSYNGREYEIEGGYGIISRNRSEIVSSISHGGKIIDINKLLRNIYYNNIKYFLNEKDIFKIFKICIDTAKAINLGANNKDNLKYMGIDLLLEYQKSIKPIVLEINSRPSGLTYIKKISLRENNGEASIMKNLMKYIDNY